MEGHPQLDDERQGQAREYARLRRRLMVVSMAAHALYLILWLGMGWVQPALSIAHERFSLVSPWWVDLLLVAIALSIPWTGATLPLAYYRGYILPHRYGLSTQDLKGWIVDSAKAAGVSLAMGTPLLLALYGLIRADPDGWWLWAAAGYTLVSTVLAALAPLIILPIFFKPEPLGDQYEELRQRLLRLGRGVGARIEGVYKIDMSRRTVAANAALTGLGRTRRILLGDTLLENFDEDEIETILAHELAHQVHRDIPLSLLFESVLNFLAFFVLAWALKGLTGPLGFSGPADPAGLPALALLMGAFALVTMPLGNAFSRWRERMADDFALSQTGNPQAFARAMTRLANQNLADADPERWVVLLLHSHPPLRERIERAQAMGQPET
jgi:STE24 endopeptidase